MTQKTQEKKRPKIWKLGRKGKVQRSVKDRLFRFLFANDREALLQSYNALNGTDYQDASQLEIVTIESAVYVVMKNDLAFVLAGTLGMYEHQSTHSPNLPVRFLIYLAQEYQRVIERAEISLYGSAQIMLPTPQCVVFYNGTEQMPEEQILRLSDAFENRGAEADAVDYCIENGILEEFLRKNRAEVLGMLLEEFDVKKYERTLRSEGREEGIREGMELGMKRGIEQGIEQGIRCMVEALQETGQTKDDIADKIAEKYALSQIQAEEKTERYWK